MFDVGFWELAIIAIVALLVIGPERLPGVARTAGLWIGKIRGFVTSVKADIDKELQAEELKKILERQAQSTGIHDILEETEQAINKIQQPDYLVKSPDNDEALRQELELMSGGTGLEEPRQDANAQQEETKSVPQAPEQAPTASDSGSGSGTGSQTDSDTPAQTQANTETSNQDSDNKDHGGSAKQP